MHSIYHVNKALYTESIKELVTNSAQKYDKTCYISFNDPFTVVVKFLETLEGVDKSKFIVVDSSDQMQGKQVIDKQTYTMPIHDIFRVYMFLREKIMSENVNHVFIDSLSALIHKFSDFPLKRMLSDLLLEVGQYRCDTSMVIFQDHSEHDIVNGLRPFVGKNVRM